VTIDYHRVGAGTTVVLIQLARQAPRARERLPWARHVTLGAGQVPFLDDPTAAAETIRPTVTAAEARMAL
jgi:hypothetical protein